ncbi:MAG TPA: sigma-70 family RNA polymerase sigma factor [Candidatus Binataceae bacterium]|nr:sigma-70 family RNA polymerase sigma factor [Candidatus Binataceae bacterium]
MDAAAAEFCTRYAAAIDRLYKDGNAARWNLDRDAFADALYRAAAASGAAGGVGAQAILDSIRAEDLALAIACKLGIGAAWEHFITTLRPNLYSAARAIAGDDMRGRELADPLWADLYGLEAREGRRRPLLDYYHGRSSLLTWLRAVLAQRHIDYIRASGRTEPLEGRGERAADASQAAAAAVDDPPEPERARFVEAMGQAMAAALASLAPRDRMRLGYYYRHQMSLKEIGRLLSEHESSVSRKLAHTRAEVKSRVDRALREDGKLSREQIALCYDYAAGDLPIDLARAFPEAK